MKIISTTTILIVLLIAFKQVDIETENKKALNTLKIRIAELESKIKRMLPRKITVTAYSSTTRDIDGNIVATERQTDSSPFITAYMEPVRKWTIACSNDLTKDGWLPGDHVYLFSRKNGRDFSFGMFEISDRMHPRKKEHCDIWVNEEKFARKIGNTPNVWAILIKNRELN